MNLKHQNFHTLIIAFFICAITSIFFRLYPLRHQQPDDKNERATLFVINQMRQRVSEKITTTHPDLSAKQQDILIRESLNTIIQTENNQLKTAVKQVADQMEDSRGTANYPYLLASDSFYYYDLTQRLLKTGRYSDHYEGSKFIHPLMLAPLGHKEPINGHPYIGLAIYRIIALFNPDIPLMYAVSFTPLVLSTLALIPFFAAGIALGCRALALLPAGLFLTLSPIFMKRSAFGWYDNDPYNILFPLIILSAIFQVLIRPQSHKSASISGMLVAVLIGVYAFFWQGWVFFFGTLVASLVIRVLYGRFIAQKDTLTGIPFLIFTLTLLSGTFLLISLSFGPAEFFVLFKEGWVALQNFMEPQLSNWPDLYMSVGELKSASWSDISQQSGGVFFLLTAFGGLTFSLISVLRRKEKINASPLIFLGTILALSLFITLGAQRFLILCLPPLSLCFTLGLHWLLVFIEQATQRITRYPRLRASLNIGLQYTLIALIAFLPIQTIRRQLPRLLNPIYNSTWDRAMLYLNHNTPTNSIINTWWPPGHFIKAIAQRAVSFDGASINYPQSYWISNALLQDDENLSLGIFRMLNNSGHLAAEYLKDKGFTTLQSVALLREIVKRPEFMARMILSGSLKNSDDVNAILKMTHAPAPPSYVFLYNEFMENNIQLKFFGNWNFAKIAEINADPHQLARVPPRKSREYIDFLWNLAGGPSRYSGPLDEIGRKNGMILFEQNLSIDETTKACLINSKKYGRGIPLSIFYEDNGKIVEKMQEGGDKPYSVVLIKNQDRYQAILMDRYLAESMLIKMYFFNAKDLKYVDLVYQDSDIPGRTKIKIFKINWPEWEKDLR